MTADLDTLLTALYVELHNPPFGADIHRRKPCRLERKQSAIGSPA